MIKRQFYALEHPSHRENDDCASSSSSSSSSDLSADSPVDHGDVTSHHEAGSPASDSQSDASSIHDGLDAEVEAAATAWRSQDASEEATDSEKDEGWKQNRRKGKIFLKKLKELSNANAQYRVSNQWATAVDDTEKEKIQEFSEECVLICKGVLKCRLCPKVICLSENTMEAHLASKRHARSLKQLAEGKLNAMLNSDGEAEEDGETHAERYARTISSAEQVVISKRKRDSGRQRQRKRTKRKAFLAGKGDKVELPSDASPPIAVQDKGLKKIKRGESGNTGKKTRLEKKLAEGANLNLRSSSTKKYKHR